MRGWGRRSFISTLLLQWQSTLRASSLPSTMDKSFRHARLRIVQIHIYHACQDKTVLRGRWTCFIVGKFLPRIKRGIFLQWEKLEMSALEVRKLWCAVAFHAVAALCVAWSLYVLVERSVEEARRGFVDWSFWTKLIVVVIGSTGGLVFMYIQCKAYITLCRKWRAFNR